MWLRLGLALWLAHTSGRALAQARAEPPVKTTICDLVEKPDRFHGRLVQVRGGVVVLLGLVYLTETSCSANVGVARTDLRQLPATGQYVYLESQADLEHLGYLNWKSVETLAPVKFKEDESFRTLLRLLDEQIANNSGGQCLNCAVNEVTATVTGRFEHIRSWTIAYRDSPSGKVSVIKLPLPKASGDDAPYSQQPFWMVVQTISDVTAKPLQRPLHYKDQ